MTGERDQPMQPRMLELFAGIGGIGAGLTRALGAVPVAVSEYEPPNPKTGRQVHGDYAAALLSRRFPNAPNLGDVTGIDWQDVAAQHGPIDIICGGFPCQDISLAGKGAGIADGTRSGLWSCFADAIRVLRPRVVVVENVAALLARGIDRVVADLAACGMDVSWDCIPAAAVGAPHRRDRVWLIAYPEQLLRTPVVWHEPHRNPAVVPAAGTNSVGLWPTPAAADARGTRKRDADGNMLGGAATNPAREGSGGDDLATAVARRETFPTPAARDWRSGKASDEVYDRNARPLNEVVERSAGHVAPLNPEFVEWLMGFPRGWSDLAVDAPEGGLELDPWAAGEWEGVPRVLAGVDRRTARLHCLGNAVVPQVAAHVGDVIRRNGLLKGIGG